MKTGQQSWKGSDEMSYVPIFFAVARISILSAPISGRNTGIRAAASTATRFRSVCDATCPRLSPVSSASARSRRAISSADAQHHSPVEAACARLPARSARFPAGFASNGTR